MDGYASGNDMPLSARNYGGHDAKKPIVLIDTHDDSLMHKAFMKKTYGDNQYIISPDIHTHVEGVLPNFQDKNIPLFRKIAHDYIYGKENPSGEQ